MRYRAKDSAAFVQTAAAEAEEQRQEEQQKRRPRRTGAHTTTPIKDFKEVQRWLAIAKAHDAHMREGGVSWYLLLVLGFNTALRIGDMCKLKVRDVRGCEVVHVVQDKTGKMSNVPLKASTQDFLARALKGRGDDEYIFASRQKDRKGGGPKPISRQRCYAIVKEIAGRAGHEGRVGCHTLRKTFAWEHYQANGDMAMLQEQLNHESQMATIRYLGLDLEALRGGVNRMRDMM